MTSFDIAHQRLHNQYISRPVFEQPVDVVSWFGAVQAQDYPGSLWAIGLRMQNAKEKSIEKAIADKTIVRTWPMRRTLHFVAAIDIHWMLKLLASRMVAISSQRLYQHFGLDESIFTRSKRLFAKALEGGKQLTRPALYKLLEAARISTTEGRGLHILSQLSQEGFICFGAREGKQATFALLDEWAPTAKTLERDEALAELASRYFTSHAPATLQDFIWWSGLKTADAKAALEMVKAKFTQEIIEGKTYWFPSTILTAKAASPEAYLLPTYDEYTVAYKDRSAVLDPLNAKESGNGIFSPSIVLDGKIVGIWKRSLKKDRLVITPTFFKKLNKFETRALAATANRYGEFLGASVVLP